jgi:hypothetical protein
MKPLYNYYILIKMSNKQTKNEVQVLTNKK